MDFNIGAMLRTRALIDPDRPALIFEGRAVNYREFNNQSNRWANTLLDFGVKRGNRVGIILPNCSEFLEAYFGAAKIGAVSVPMNCRLGAQELENMCEDSGIESLVFDVQYAQVAEAIKSKMPLKGVISIGSGGPAWAKDYRFVAQHQSSEPKCAGGGDEVALILYTAGTTGRPKAIPYSHQTILWWLTGFMTNLEFSPGGKVLAIAPLFHGLSLTIAVASTFRGCATVIMRAFDPMRVLEIIRDEKIEIFAAVPTMLQRMSEISNFEAYLKSLRTVVSAGAPISAELLQKYMHHGINVRDGYGLNENGWMGFSKRSENTNGRQGIVPLFYNEIRVVDEHDVDVPPGRIGEILVKGPTLMKGYWNNPEATRDVIKDGWLHTNDMGRIDEEGYLFLAGRKDDMIISGGENIHPIEIEDLLRSNPKVADAAVIGLPDKVWGETVCAIIRPKENQKIAPDEVVEFCRGKIANFKLPKRVVIRNEPLPHNAVGKKLRHALRDQMKSAI